MTENKRFMKYCIDGKRFAIVYDNQRYFCIVDEKNEKVIARLDTMRDAEAVLELIEIYEGLR